MVEGGELAGEHGGAVTGGIGPRQNDHPLAPDGAQPAGGVDVLVAYADLELPGHGFELHQECGVVHTQAGTSSADVAGWVDPSIAARRRCAMGSRLASDSRSPPGWVT